MEQVEKGDINFDLAIATPDMMALVGRLGRILGPRGLMPNPRAGTVTMDVGKAVQEFKGGKVEFRTNKEGGVHVPIGKASFDEKALQENFQALMDAIVKAKPAAARGQYVRRVAVSTTMGPGIRLNPQEAAVLRSGDGQLTSVATRLRYNRIFAQRFGRRQPVPVGA